MVVSHATLCVTTPIADDLIARWARAEDVTAVHDRQDKTISLLARALARSLLFERTRRADWIISRDDRGKPIIEGGPSLSLSHSSGLAAAAVADSGDLGIDVERHRRRNYGALADYAFGPAERLAVEEGGELAFFRIWTLREAIAKATGEGIALAANRQDLVGGMPPFGAWRSGAWRLQHHPTQAGFSLATAWRGQSLND